MDISIFSVLGPVMIGPSSSHTAGAAKLARIAKMIAQTSFHHVSFGLHGSFAMTYKGHGTDRALVAGVLGISEKDERLIESFEIAEKEGLSYEFYTVDLGDVHENTVKFTFDLDNGSKVEVVGSSIGGGEIVIKKINDFDTNLSAKYPTVMTKHYDKKGVLSEITGVLADNEVNIGTLSLSRTAKGETALCIIEVDSPISKAIQEQLQNIPNMISVMTLNLLEEAETNV